MVHVPSCPATMGPSGVIHARPMNRGSVLIGTVDVPLTPRRCYPFHAHGGPPTNVRPRVRDRRNFTTSQSTASSTCSSRFVVLRHAERRSVGGPAPTAAKQGGET